MKNALKVSIITVVFNNKDTIGDTIASVASQNYPYVEHIIVDGLSTDGTMDIITANKDRFTKVISEPDKGIYDAMNKGIAAATGDIIGCLNGDDFYADNEAISTVVREFEAKGVDSVFADLVYVKREDPSRVVRYYDSSSFHPGMFAYGWMPAHPTFFVKRSCYKKYGVFKTDYAIAADYEMLARMLGKHRITYSHIPRVLTKMRTGGVSTKNFKSNWILNREIMRACKENGIQTNYFKIYSKYATKMFQLVQRPKCGTGRGGAHL